MRVIVACEFSGVVRRAFAKRGHHAVSCDLLPSEDDAKGYHFQRDIFEFLLNSAPFDLMIAHPPCTRLAGSGARWWKDHMEEVAAAEEFFTSLWQWPTPRICIENPVGRMSRYFKPAQYIQPWQFGHGETKKTGLWLKNLPLLQPTEVVEGREQRVWKMAPSPERWKERSRTYEGIALAMADQWGSLPPLNAESPSNPQ